MIYIIYVYLFYKFSSIILSIYLCFVLKSDKLNKNNVCLVFYRPKRNFYKFIKNLCNGCLFSSGLVIGNKLYQMRKENKTLQERDYTEEYIKDKYLIIDTKFNINFLCGDYRDNLLKQKARQLKTLFIRKNCLRSLRFVLNQIKGFEYKGEILPILYLLKLKKTKKIK